MKEHYGESVWSDGSRASQETPYDELAMAIVRQAVKDYVRITTKLWKRDLSIIRKRNLMLEMVELKEFFYSDWYDWLTDIDPELIIARCKVTAREKKKQAIKNRNKAKIRKLLKEQEEQQGQQEQHVSDHDVVETTVSEKQI